LNRLVPRTLSRLSPKAQAAIIVAFASLSVLIVVGGLLIVPRHAIVVLTIAAILIGCGALMITPGLVSAERYRRRATGEGTGAHDASTHRGLCAECGWHWRASKGDRACPRCGAAIIPPDNAPPPSSAV
jgi:hypothetical protein